MTIKIDQALIQSFIDGAFGLGISHENEDYAPTVGTAHVELKVMQNEVTPFSLDNLDDLTGLFQFTLKYPTNTGAIAAKTKCTEIFTAYPVGRELTYGGQTLKITGKQRVLAYPNGSWYNVVGRLNFVAILPR